MLSALGARFLDADGEPVAPGGGGAGRTRRRPTCPGLDPRLADVDLVLASDVDNPLTGPKGAPAVYGPQKGASPDDVAALDAALAHYATVLETAIGAKAAGYAARAGCGRRRRHRLRRPGPRRPVPARHRGHARRPRLRARAGPRHAGDHRRGLPRRADPARQGPGGRRGGRPGARASEVVAVCGRLALRPEALGRAGIRRAYPLTELEPDLAKCIADAGPILERVAEYIGRDFLV